MYFAYGLGAYLTVATFFLPTFAGTKRKMKEARNEFDWGTGDSVTVALASLMWPLVIAHFLYATVVRFFRGGK